MINITYDRTQNSVSKDGGILRKIDTIITVNGNKYYNRSLIFGSISKDKLEVFSGEVHFIYDCCGLPKGEIKGELTRKKLSELFLRHGIIA